MRKTALTLCLLVASSLFGGQAAAEKLIALVIGNSKYVNVRMLANPESDANAVADLLRKANFDIVDASNNLNGTEMRRVFRDFAEKSRGADIAVVYYAGHGIEIDGTNYLLPVDADVQDAAGVHKGAGDAQILGARGGISGGMIVRDDDGGGVRRDGTAEHFTRVNKRGIDEAQRDNARVDDVVLGVQVDDEEKLLRGVAD
ncbi:MAG: caspase family protein, partial [Hyphomicrobiales bacterium]